MEFAQSGDDEGDVFVGHMLDEVRGLRPRLAEDCPALFVDAVDQDRQQQPVIGIVDVEQPFPAFDVEVDGCVEPLTPWPRIDATAGLGGKARRIILRSVEERRVDRNRFEGPTVNLC